MQRGAVRIALAALLLAAAPAYAVTPKAKAGRRDPRTVPITADGFTVEVRRGFSGRYDPALPVPILITAENTTDRPISGVWEIEEFQDGDPWKTVRVIPREMFVGPASAKRLRLCLRMEDGSHLALRFRAGRKLVWQNTFAIGCSLPFSQSGMLAALNTTAINVLTVSGSDMLPPYALFREGPDDPETKYPAFAPGERPVTTTRIRSWELPFAAPPLMAFHAVVIGHGPLGQALESGHGHVLADYLCWGGTLVVSRKDRASLEKIRAALPEEARFDLPDPQRTEAPLTRVPTYSGTLILAPDTLFDKGVETDALKEELIRFLESTIEPAFPPFFTSPQSYRWQQDTPNAATSMTHAAFFFLVYTLLTGPVVLMVLRHRRRKVIGWYVGITVGLFSLLAAVMGPVLSYRRGDMEWLTITELTPTGGIQWGMMTLTSGGARHYPLRIPRRTRAWLLPSRAPEDYYSYGWSYYRGDSPYGSPGCQSMDLHAGDRLRTELPVRIAPWGHRMALAQTFWPDGRPLPVEVSLDSEKNQIRATVTNGLPVSILRMQLVLGYWKEDVRYSRGSDETAKIDFYEIIGLPAARTRDIRHRGAAPNKFQSHVWNLRHRLSPQEGSGRSKGLANVLPLRALYEGIPFGYLVMEVKASPHLRFDRDSFESNKGSHLVIQRIPPEKLPSVAALEAARPAPANRSLRR
jgi:hypothetical protein